MDAQRSRPLGRQAAALSRGGRRLPLALLAALALLAFGCAAPPPEVVTPPVGGLVATLEETRQPLPDGRLAWSAIWQLCWADYPNAQGYELGILTGEGASPKLRRQSERCIRIEAAAAEAARDELENQRAILLSTQAGQLSYRVRALLPSNRVTAWSAPYPVGRVTPAR